jgi:hypothetical protein
MRKALLAAALAVLLASAGVAAACRQHDTGYFAPRFTADGSAVVMIVREARAMVTGLGYETFTPPARSRVSRDRFSLVRVRLADRKAEVLATFPPSPVEGRWIETYRPRIYGSATAHLRWAEPGALEYEIGVSIPKQPSSETYVLERRWDAGTRAWIGGDTWRPGSTGMGGSDPSQLHGDREVVAVAAGGGAMACAVVIVTEGQARGEPVVESASCRKAHPDGYQADALTDLLRRDDIERAALLRSTHDRLVAEARARGRSEGDAAMDAIGGMRRLGLYPRPPMLVATRVEAADPSAPLFAISDEEFRVGLFADLREALDRPGEEVEKSSGAYIVHRDFDTSRQLNAFLTGQGDVTFFVDADGAVWRVHLDRP